jgi:hypothetical protein
MFDTGAAASRPPRLLSSKTAHPPPERRLFLDVHAVD